ncbi:SDR family NAD(P)-dependent oxidoreductase [Kordiimonas gwangyangensis]|uniref:SDR family NAD(P)-dependent oxidoreductase n=1 Tax=Kordiimonas gwangyangensis TaxID=288022 RepID=UPI00037D03C0|nr:SDR family NAD(P)-dependent oxidoreductase [Kordiimonas gwangyangensis]
MTDIKTAFITGAASGIGRALALALARDGVSLYLTDINADALAKTCMEVKALQSNVHMRALDVADRDAVNAAAADAEAKLGPVDAVFNNAGVSLSDTVDRMSYEDLDWLMGINFYGVVYGTKAFLPSMLARRSGHIINVSSLFGLIGVGSQSAYCAAKHAVKGFNESLFYELDGTGVQVHSVHPGGVDTNIVLNGKHLHNVQGDTSAEQAQEGFRDMIQTTAEGAAQIILDGVKRGQYRILVGPDARRIDRLQRWMPNRWRKMFLKAMAERRSKTPF